MADKPVIILGGKQKVVAERQSEREEAKSIVREVVDHGISQKQILYIIRNLALELENSEHTKQIYNAAKDIIEKSTIIMP